MIETDAGGPTLAVLLHVPHASLAIPAEVRSTFLLDDEALADELLRMSDRYTDELFALPPELALTMAYPVSRLVLDPNGSPTTPTSRWPKKGWASSTSRPPEEPAFEPVPPRPSERLCSRVTTDPITRDGPGPFSPSSTNTAVAC